MKLEKGVQEKRNLPGAFAFPERHLPERGVAEPG